MKTFEAFRDYLASMASWRGSEPPYDAIGNLHLLKALLGNLQRNTGAADYFEVRDLFTPEEVDFLRFLSRAGDRPEGEFSFLGMPVGRISNAARLPGLGDLKYEPYRGIGHVQFIQQIERRRVAQCLAFFPSGRVILEVTAVPAYGKLSISRIDPLDV